MIETLTIESFKSIQSVTLELGQVNVFIGANGSGKSNLLEALAVLSAAASGKVDQSTLVWRGCRASNHFRPMFEGYDESAVTRLMADGDNVLYDIHLKAPEPYRLLPWEFKAELWQSAGDTLLSRPDENVSYADPQTGMAALKLAEIPPERRESVFLKGLASYSIYSANTSVLHGWTQDLHEREPVGLGGGRLGKAISELWTASNGLSALNEEFRSCIDWFSDYLIWPNITINFDNQSSPLAESLVFEDRYMKKKKGVSPPLSANDVNEGALYLAFLAVLGLHPLAPKLFAIENVDHGLNPLLAKRLMATLTERILSAESKRQVFLTTHNPLVLDGLPLGDDRVRLFTVDRDNKGHTVVKRFIVTDKHREMAEKGWTLSRMWINKLIGGVPDV